MDIDGLGPAIVETLIQNGLIAGVAALYTLTEKQSAIRSLEGMITALGIRNVGVQAARVLAASFPDIQAIRDADEETLAALPDFGPVTAASVTRFFAQEQTRHLLDRLAAAGVNMNSSTYGVQTGGAFEGMTFVLTGALPGMTREEAETLIRSQGGKAAGSVSARTTYVLAGEGGGSKLDKAARLGIPVIGLDGLLRMIEGSEEPAS
jgi:DNA ligase (NAD+)